jgi:(hydroxyamino)benzene mutase
MAGVGAAGRRRRPASRRASIRASSSSRLARSALAPMYPLPNYVGIGEERAMMSDERQRSVIWHGMLLFLLGLLTGLAEPHFINPRMGLAAHLEGLMNGTFLIALGAIWQYLKLPDRMLSRTYWFALYGAYANWATTTLAAIVGANSLSVITGTGHSALPWQETLVTLGFVSVGLAMLATSILALWGLRRTIVA